MGRPPKSLLKDSHPELAKQVVDKTLLATLATGSNAKIEWKGSCGHIWSAAVYNRTNAKNATGCPICLGKTVLRGYNDLYTTHPDVAALAEDPELPYQLTANSNKKIKWKCDQGHIWEAPVSRLTGQKSRCPFCSGRIPIIGSTSLKDTHPDLVKELIDPSYGETTKAGSSVALEWQCPNDPSHRYTMSVYHRALRHGSCPYCNEQCAQVGVTDFGTRYPELSKTLKHPELATTFMPNSALKVEWVCEKNSKHTWFAAPYNRIRGGCPICANRKVIPGENDLATTHPHLIAELIDPTMATKITYGSGKQLKWKCNKGHTWFATAYNRTGNNETGCPVCNPTGTNKAEQEIAQIVKTLAAPSKVLTNNKKLLNNNMELDIVIPDKHLAIEYNGTRWHSTQFGKPNNYHAKKQKLCKEKGYDLIYIWEDDWLAHPQIIIQFLAYKLQATNKLAQFAKIDPKCYERHYARTLIAKQVNGSEAAAFLKTHHIQGKVSSSYHYGLYDKNQILRAILSLRSPKQNARMKRHTGEWEIQRYATYGLVPGGFSKLLKYAEKNLLNQHIPLNKWISFSSNDISNGDLYEQNGFTCVASLPPDYKYVGDYTQWKRQPKEKFQKAKIKANPHLIWNDDWTERIATEKNNLYRVYDSGKLRWEKSI